MSVSADKARMDFNLIGKTRTPCRAAWPERFLHVLKHMLVSKLTATPKLQAHKTAGNENCLMRRCTSHIVQPVNQVESQSKHQSATICASEPHSIQMVHVLLSPAPCVAMISFLRLILTRRAQLDWSRISPSSESI